MAAERESGSKNIFLLYGRMNRPLAYFRVWTPLHTALRPHLWAAHYTTLDASLRLHGRAGLRPTTRFAGFDFHMPLPLCNVAISTLHCGYPTLSCSATK